MVEAINSRTFHETSGVEDWRIVSVGATAYFETGSFATGVEFVRRIGELADEMNHHPNVELRYSGVRVSLSTHELAPHGLLSERDSSLAARISQAAAALGIRSLPERIQAVQIAIDALDIAKVRPFWLAVLGYEPAEDADAIDPLGIGPNVWFQHMSEPRPQRNRIHVDLYVPVDQARARIAAALEAGGSVVNDSFAPDWWTLADPEGNEVDVAPWPDARDDAV